MALLLLVTLPTGFTMVTGLFAWKIPHGVIPRRYTLSQFQAAGMLRCSQLQHMCFHDFCCYSLACDITQEVQQAVLHTVVNKLDLATSLDCLD